MAKPFSELTKDFSEERKAKIDKMGELLILEYGLISQLRKDQELTQQALADLMEIQQNALSRIERQEDVLVSTLEKYVKALGGELEIRAKFPDRVIELHQFTRQAAPERGPEQTAG